MPEVIVGHYDEVLAELDEALPYVLLVNLIEHAGLYCGLDKIVIIEFFIA